MVRQRSKSMYISPDELEAAKTKEIKKVLREDEEHIPSVDFKQLINEIRKQIPSDDVQPFDFTLKNIKWKKLQLGDSSTKEFKKKVLTLIDNVRKHRILSEILDDVIDLYDKKSDGKEEIVNKLNLEEPNKAAKKSNKAQVFIFYYNSVKESGVKYADARKAYQALDDSEKLQYILKYLNVNHGEKLSLEQYNHAKEELNHYEMDLIDEYEKKPKKHMSAFNKFLQNYLKKLKANGTELPHSTLFKQAAEAWKSLPEHEKEILQKESNEEKLKYLEDVKRFEATLPEDRKVKKGKKSKKVNAVKDDNLKQRKMENFVVSTKRKNSENEDTDTEKIKKKKKLNSESENENSLKKRDKKKLNSESENEISLKKKDKKKLNSESENEISLKKKDKKSGTKIDKKNNETELSFSKFSANGENEEPAIEENKKTAKSKKKNKLEQQNSKNEIIVKEPFNLKKPPESLFKYYVISVHQGPKNTAKSSYKNLSESERKKLVKKHKKATQAFLEKFTAYLNTLSVEEMEEFQENFNFDEESFSDISYPSSEDDSDSD